MQYFLRKDYIFLCLFFYMFVFPSVSLAVATGDHHFRIGVLAKRGKKICLKKWNPTAYFLNTLVDGSSFSIAPLAFEEVIPAVRSRKIDFVLVNPAIYIMLEKKFGANRIATMKNIRSGHVVTKFGSVIFTRTSNEKIKDIKDLRHKSFMAVDPFSFGGWYMAWRCLVTLGIDPPNDFNALKFGHTHDQVVYAVRDGEVDAGAVRSDTLERMAQEGKIRLSDFRVLKRDGELKNTAFPFLVTTRLYPEWPFAVLSHVPLHLSEKVSSALLRMGPEDDAAKEGNYAGWTIPLNYEPVAGCLKTLGVPPYDREKVSVAAFIKQHMSTFIVSCALFLSVVLFSVYSVKLNRRLAANLKKIAEEQREKDFLYSKLLHAQKLESIGELAAGIAHEINTPVQYVISNLDFMRDAISGLQDPISEIESISEELKGDPSTSAKGQRIEDALEEADWEYMSEELPKAIKQSREGAEKVAGIVRAMKEFAHPGGSKSMELQDINQIIDTTLTISKNEWKYVADLEFTPDTSLPPVPCLKDAMGQTILNLIVNSAHAIENKIGKNPEGQKGKITITTLKTKNMVEIRVSDTGTGIPSDIIDRIFDPFFTTKEVGRGSGQGLAISYDIVVNKHGGELNVETAPGEGSTFIISLPLKERLKEE